MGTGLRIWISFGGRRCGCRFRGRRASACVGNSRGGFAEVDTEVVPRRQLAKLSRYGVQGKASLLRRHGDFRRAATLLAAVTYLQSRAVDDAGPAGRHFAWPEPCPRHRLGSRAPVERVKTVLRCGCVAIRLPRTPARETLPVLAPQGALL